MKVPRTRKKDTGDDALDAKAQKLIDDVEDLIARLRAAEKEFLEKGAPLLRELERMRPVEDASDDDDRALEKLVKGYEKDLDELGRYIESGVTGGKPAETSRSEVSAGKSQTP